MKKSKALFIFGVIFFIVSCSSTPHKKSELTPVEDGFPIHGNFCGPNIPSVNTHNMKLWIKRLNRIKPHDTFDLICKKHDICYAKNGYHNIKCDKNFIDSFRTLEAKSFSTSCLSLASVMTSYFIAANPSRAELEEYVDNIVLNTMFQGAYAYTSAGVYFYKAYMSLALLVYSPVIVLLGGVSLSEMGELLKMPFESTGEEFTFYPERFDTCSAKT